MNRTIPIQARYVGVEQVLIITLKSGAQVRGRVSKVTKEKGRPTAEGRVHVELEGHTRPYTLDPHQTVHVL